MTCTPIGRGEEFSSEVTKPNRSPPFLYARAKLEGYPEKRDLVNRFGCNFGCVL